MVPPGTLLHSPVPELKAFARKILSIKNPKVIRRIGSAWVTLNEVHRIRGGIVKIVEADPVPKPWAFRYVPIQKTKEEEEDQEETGDTELVHFQTPGGVSKEIHEMVQAAAAKRITNLRRGLWPMEPEDWISGDSSSTL
jgi:hypothetical protein